MYQDYDRVANQVIDHLTKRHCAFRIIYMNKRCFCLFKEYMTETAAIYNFSPSEGSNLKQRCRFRITASIWQTRLNK